MCDLTERDDHSNPRKRAQTRLEIVAAGRDLTRLGLVGWREAFDGVENDGACKPQTIARVGTIFALGQSELEQSRVKELACIIAGERTACAVRAMLSRSETDNRKPCVPIAERGNGRVPPIRKLDPTLLAKCDQARAQRTVARRFGLRDRGQL